MKIAKKFSLGAKALALLASSFLLFGTTACSNDDDGEVKIPVIPTNVTDNIIRLNFADQPEIVEGGFVEIYDGDEKVDTINVADETYVSINDNKGQFGTIKVDDQLIVTEERADDTYDLVIVTHTDDDGYSKLKPNTTYTVKLSNLIADEADKTFVTKAAMVAGTTIAVGPNGNFTTIQGAFNYLRSANATGDWTINVAEGKYHERLSYSGNANITLVGPNEDNEYGEKVYVYWRNNQNMGNNGQRSRVNFVFAGGDLTIRNMSFDNTTSRQKEGNTNVQAETLNFDVPNKLVVYNSSFYSYQDTLVLGNNGGKAWFYKSKIAGDVDFIWGTLDVGLFEDCVLVCRADGIKNSAEILASRTAQKGDVIGKGYVLLNSEIQIEEGCDAFYGRSSGGGDCQAAVLGCRVTGGAINPKLWHSKMDKATVYDPAKDAAVAFKSYNNKDENGTEISTVGKIEGTEDLTKRVAEREYNGRWVILNRVFNVASGAYENSSSIWNIATIAAAYNAPADDSVNNIFVDPVYVKNLPSTGTGVKLTVSAATLSNLTYTFKTDADTYANVDGTGQVTPVKGADGITTITVTASNGKIDTAQIKIIPEGIAATAMKIETAPDSLHKYELADVTAVFEPAGATTTDVKWTASGDIKIVDTDKKTLVDTITTTSEHPAIVIMATGSGQGSIKAASVDYPNATEGTKEISVDEIVYYNSWDGYILQDKNLYGILNFQNAKSGIWHDIVVEGRESNSKINPGSPERVQTRGVNLYIPVDGNKKIDIVCQKFNDNLDVADFEDGDGGAPKYEYDPDSDETYKFHYTFNYNAAVDSAKTVSGADLKNAFNSWTIDTSRSLVNATPDSEKTYFKIKVGSTDRYWAYITVEDYEPSGATMTVANFDTPDVELDLASTSTYSQTTTAQLVGGTGTPTIKYSTDNSNTLSVDETTGAVTAIGMGVAKVIATAEFDGLEAVTKSYQITVKDTRATEDDYEFDLTKIHGSAGDWGKFAVAGGTYHNDHGWIMQNGSTLSVKVNGASKVSLKGCKHSNGSLPIVQLGETVLTTSVATLKPDECEELLTWIYGGTESDTVVFTFTGTAYVHGVKVEKYEASGVEITAGDFTNAEVTLDLGTSNPTVTQTISASVSNDSTATITYASSKPLVAEVDSATGTVTAKGIGRCVITATVAASKAEAVTKTYKVTVKNTATPSGEYKLDLKAIFESATIANSVDFGIASLNAGSKNGYSFNGTTHGITYKEDNRITLTVKGGSTITITQCACDKAHTVLVSTDGTAGTAVTGVTVGGTNNSSVSNGVVTIPAGDSSSCGKTTVITIPADFVDTSVTLVNTATAQAYLHEISVAY
ncbi:MAG: hypothetical protein K2J50_00110 [Treponemataceae bacterium]|nr:hypothetical protein [Treponemataceae bacterium]